MSLLAVTSLLSDFAAVGSSEFSVLSVSAFAAFWKSSYLYYFPQVIGSYLKIHQYFLHELLLEGSHLWTSLESLNMSQAQAPLSQGSLSPFKSPSFSGFLLVSSPRVWTGVPAAKPDLDNGAEFSVVRPCLDVCSGEAFCCFFLAFQVAVIAWETGIKLLQCFSISVISSSS